MNYLEELKLTQVLSNNKKKCDYLNFISDYKSSLLNIAVAYYAFENINFIDPKNIDNEVYINFNTHNCNLIPNTWFFSYFISRAKEENKISKEETDQFALIIKTLFDNPDNLDAFLIYQPEYNAYLFHFSFVGDKDRAHDCFIYEANKNDVYLGSTRPDSLKLRQDLYRGNSSIKRVVPDFTSLYELPVLFENGDSELIHCRDLVTLFENNNCEILSSNSLKNIDMNFLFGSLFYNELPSNFSFLNSLRLIDILNKHLVSAYKDSELNLFQPFDQDFFELMYRDKININFKCKYKAIMLFDNCSFENKGLELNKLFALWNEDRKQVMFDNENDFLLLLPKDDFF
tara:strand:- start:3107 stop:4138 length:1032 start_codon:yes stop_codon:yes gene_type:complete